MLKRVKKVLNLSLVKSYKDKNGNYIITDSFYKFIDSSRLFTSIREISKVTSSTRIKLHAIQLRTIHLSLLARGLKNNNEVNLVISFCKCSSKTTMQLITLIVKLPKVTTEINYFFLSDEQRLVFLYFLSSLTSWQCQNLFKKTQVFFKYKKSFVSKFREKTLHQKLLNIFAKNIHKIKSLEFSKISNYNFFKRICCLTLTKTKSGKESLIGKGNIRIRLD